MAKKKIKINGTIEDYPLVKVSTLDWVSNSEWMHIDKAARLKPDKCFAVGYLLTKSRSKVQTFSFIGWNNRNNPWFLGIRNKRD